MAHSRAEERSQAFVWKADSERAPQSASAVSASTLLRALGTDMVELPEMYERKDRCLAGRRGVDACPLASNGVSSAGVD